MPRRLPHPITSARRRVAVMTTVAGLLASVATGDPVAADGMHATDSLAHPRADAGALDFHIEDALLGNAVGASWVINADGGPVRTGALGVARGPLDGQVTMSTDARLDVMSVTKTVTAVAVLQLLEANGLSIWSPIGPWLPAAWEKGPGVVGPSGLTFHELLTHTSGLGQVADALDEDGQERWNTGGGQDWEALEFVAATGTWPVANRATHPWVPRAPRNYENANSSLFRAIIPALWAATPSFPHDDRSVGAVSSVVNYLQYVQQHVLEPIGVTGAGECSSDEPALAYSTTADELGRLVERHNDCGGSMGLHLSAMDLARFMAHLVHSDVLLSPTGRALMDAHRLGWNDGSNRFESLGVFWHGGAYRSPAGRNGRQELNTCVMKFPYGLQASVVVNSRIFDGRDLCAIVLDAYHLALP